MLNRLIVSLLLAVMGLNGLASAANVLPKPVTALTVNGYPAFPDPNPDPDPQPGAQLNPSRAAYFIGGERNYCTDLTISRLATYNFRLYGVWDGWQGSFCAPSAKGGRTMQQALALTKSSSRLNEVGAVNESWAYIETWFTPSSAPGNVDNEQWVRYNASNGWLRLQWPSGSIVGAFFDAAKPMWNPYPGAGATNGETDYVWNAKYWGCFLIAPNGYCDGGNSGYSGFAGIVWDDVLYHPGTCDNCAFAADWNRDNITDQGTNTAFWPGIQQGQVNQENAFIAQWPTQGKRGGNVSQLGNSFASGKWPVFNNLFDYGVMETQIGTNYAAETFGGTAETVQQVARMKGALKSGGRGGYGQVNMGSQGTDPRDRSNLWRAQKFGFALALILDTDYAPMFTDSVPDIPNAGASPNDVNIQFWFDYWGVDRVTRQAQPGPNGTIGSGPSGQQLTWLGPALGNYTTTVNGILLRQFQYGFCAVAPSNPYPDNGPTRQLLPADVGGAGLFARVYGLQDTSVDNGATFNSALSMPGRSGICMPRL